VLHISVITGIHHYRQVVSLYAPSWSAVLRLMARMAVSVMRMRIIRLRLRMRLSGLAFAFYRSTKHGQNENEK
jgi:hypothetical protein